MRRRVLKPGRTGSTGGRTHLELGHELCKDAEEGVRAGGLAVLSEVGRHLGELVHGSGLQGLQGLDGRVTVLQKTLWKEDGVLLLVLLVPLSSWVGRFLFYHHFIFRICLYVVYYKGNNHQYL